MTDRTERVGYHATLPMRSTSGPSNTSLRPSQPREVDFIDRRTGLRCIIGIPSVHPDLWRQYLDGVSRAYREWGVDEAFDRRAVEAGTDTTLFCVLLDEHDAVVAGHRVQGPYITAAQSHALVEWAGQPGLARLTTALEERLPEGLVEVKSAYVGLRDARTDGAANLLSRVGLIVTELTGARHMMATAAEHVLGRWSQGGGRIDRTIPATPYPDERYRTQVMFWDRQRMQIDADPELWPLMALEFHSTIGAHSAATG